MIINYLIRDSFHFFFTHWSDVLRNYYHYFILYRSTLGWIKHIYSNKLTKQEEELYKKRSDDQHDLLNEDMMTIKHVRECASSLDKSADNFTVVEKNVIKSSSASFKLLSHASQQWVTKKRKLDDVPIMEFPLDNLKDV